MTRRSRRIARPHRAPRLMTHVAPRRPAAPAPARNNPHAFASLSIRDLLDARDAYHVHLAHKENVIATAIGRYRFAPHDPGAHDPAAPYRRGRSQPRTLANSAVTSLSPPCVMVFVRQWLPPEEFARKADEMIPPRLYLPDGRVVPTCVIYAERAERVVTPATPRFPVSALGGGYPVLADVQGQTHVGSIGCLVGSGDALYALTDRHVAGDEGRMLYTLVQGERETVGISDRRQLGKLPFEDAFPGWTARRTSATVDAGLIRIADARRWTSQVYGIGELGEMMDLHAGNLSLDLIGRSVRAYGAASGLMLGEVQGFFYRYRSVGGVDYVADLLIGPRAHGGGRLARHGNSGALWLVEPDPSRPGPRPDAHLPRPLGLHWGGQILTAPGSEEETEFALATLVSTVCRELDVEIVRDLNVGLPETWGKLGHYKIGAAACAAVTDPKLRKFLDKNLDRISFSDADLADLDSALRRSQFVALADVPDIVWKGAEAKRGRESPNHFADMDQPSDAFAGKTLLEVCTSPAKLDVALWSRFYESLDVDRGHRGLLPFRVWQLYDVMEAAARAKDVPRFLCAAGVLAHYVGDACQPLHTSYLHDGDPDSGEGKGVHSAYETRMVDTFADEIIAGVNTALASRPLIDLDGGRAAGYATVQLMRRSLKSLPPEKLIATYVANRGGGQVRALFAAHGARTIERMADGAALLASIWQAAWINGGGSGIATSKLTAVDKKTLRALYADRAFAPSVYLHMLETKNGQLTVLDS